MAFWAAADFKERREPIEGRYGWIPAVKDLSSRYQLAWLPVEEAMAELVQATYAQLFAEHGPPLVMKSDNGGPFQADSTKRLLMASAVTALFNPRRRPSYNGGIERANGQLAGYQEALAEFHGWPGMPTCDDGPRRPTTGQRVDPPGRLARPHGSELWNRRDPIAVLQRADFLAAVTERRTVVRGQFGFAA